MKTIFILVVIFSSIPAYSGSSFTKSEEIEKLYDNSTIPDFSPWLGIALPGRCFFKNPNEKKTASVLLPSMLNDSLLIAPLSADKRSASFFDELTYSQITVRFPQVEKLKRTVLFNETEAVLFRQKGGRNYEARIREFEDYFFVKVLLNDLNVRYCYYKKLNTISF